MIIKAFYDNEPCLLNTDYIIDVFKKEGKYMAYTIDVDREGYVVPPEELKEWLGKTLDN